MADRPPRICRICDGFRDWTPGDDPALHCYCPRNPRIKEDEMEAINLLRRRGFTVEVGKVGTEPRRFHRLSIPAPDGAREEG